MSEDLAIRVASRVTDRDRRIAMDCFEHRVLTTDQLQRLHFDNLRVARRRLTELREQRVLDRFRPPWQRGQGSTQYHWVLDEAGAYLVADELRLDRADLHWRHADALRIAGSPKLAHQTAVNELLTRLAVEARQDDGRLSEWYGERTTRRLLGGSVIPDAYAVLRVPGRGPLHLLIELDRGTEDHKRLHDKAARYRRALPRSALRDLNPTVLLILPNRARAHSLRAAGIEDAGPLSTAVWSPPNPEPVLPIVIDAGGPRASETQRTANFTRQAPVLADQPGSSAGPTRTDKACPQQRIYD